MTPRERKFITYGGGFVVLIIGAALFFPVRPVARESKRRVACQSNLKQISLSLQQYLQDSEGRFPVVGETDNGWANSIQPYMKSWAEFQCPSGANVPLNPGTIDYFYNARLNGAERAKVIEPLVTIALGDGENNRPQNYSIAAFPNGWHSDLGRPANRHMEGANYAFAAGHVKWYKAEHLIQSMKKDQRPTFLVR